MTSGSPDVPARVHLQQRQNRDTCMGLVEYRANENITRRLDTLIQVVKNDKCQELKVYLSTNLVLATIQSSVLGRWKASKTTKMPQVHMAPAIINYSKEKNILATISVICY